MTINAPSSTPTSQDDISPLRRMVSCGYQLWQSIRATARRDGPEMVLQPFSFWPGRASALLDAADAGAELVAGYAFHTNYVPSSGRRIRFKIRLHGLKARSGSLILAINRLDSQGLIAEPAMETVSLPALARRGGEIEISARSMMGCCYAVMGTLTDKADARAERIEISVVGGESSETLLARFDQARRDFLSAPGTGRLASVIVDRRATLEQPISQMCTAHQMQEPLYAEWCRRIGQAPSRHRKQWEFVFISRVLEHHGALRKGSRGLGFGVGIEPLASVFAAEGCHILATDLAADDDRATVWNNTDQLGANLRQIHHPHLCDEKTFFDHVSYRAVDMNAIPADLTGFDFTWSSCAYEHLGSIEAGLAFFENSLATLNPGGLAVHTTELNLSSNTDTLNDGTTVIFRRRDFEALADRLILQGHEVFPITFDSGESELDRIIDLPPYSSDPHLRLALLRWVATSFGMAVRKKI